MALKFRIRHPIFKKTTTRLNYLKRIRFENILKRYGDRGVDALSATTPIDTSETARSWSYNLERRGDVYILSWSNSVMAGSVPLVILLHYGHGTGTGGYVPPRPFINPALDPIFSELKRSLFAEVTR